MRQLLVALALVFVPDPAIAESFSDGGEHTVSGPSGAITVTNGTTVIIASGASVTNGVTVDSTSTLDLQGGNVLGANGLGPATSGGMGVTSQGIFSGTGGLVQGGASLDVGGHGGCALVSTGETQISTGTYLGGGGSTNDGIGGTALSTSLDNLRITGGSFSGGTAARNGNGAFIDGAQGGRGLISGGSFNGFNALVFWGTGNAELDISGGTFHGIIDTLLLDTSSIHFLGRDFHYDAGTGILTGQLASGNALDVTLQSITPYAVNEASSQLILTSLDPPPTPEPATIVLLGTGVLAILLARIYQS